MGAPKGNNYWQFRDKHGRNPKYNPDTLWDEFVGYSEWIEENPLYEEKGFAFQGNVTKERFSKMRAMTLTGFCLFADITLETFCQYRKQNDFSEVTTRIDNCIYTQKFEGASAELLNPNIIARDLGLQDSYKADHSGSLNIDDFSNKTTAELVERAKAISKLSENKNKAE